MRVDHLYVVAFSDGTVKVGRSVRPEQRLIEHAAAAEGFGLRIVEVEVIECVDRAVKEELELIERCRKAASDSRRYEWFSGLTFSEVAGWAREIVGRVYDMRRKP